MVFVEAQEDEELLRDLEDQIEDEEKVHEKEGKMLPEHVLKDEVSSKDEEEVYVESEDNN